MEYLLIQGELKFYSRIFFCRLYCRYIHINIHPWPKDAVFSNSLSPPPVGLCLERIVIDISRMEVVGRSLPTQRVFIPSDPDYCEAAPVQVNIQ